jgi:Domain of unknown function (DUF4399)
VVVKPGSKNLPLWCKLFGAEVFIYKQENCYLKTMATFLMKGLMIMRKIMKYLKLVCMVTSLLVTTGVVAGGSSSNDGAKVYILSPGDGATVSNPVTVRFGLSGMGVAPAGVNKDKTGHHHLLIDLKTLPDFSHPIPNDEHHRHFGGGQTEVILELTPGKHSLQLLLGDYSHIPHNPPVLSESVVITVENN